MSVSLYFWPSPNGVVLTAQHRTEQSRHPSPPRLLLRIAPDGIEPWQERGPQQAAYALLFLSRNCNSW